MTDNDQVKKNERLTMVHKTLHRKILGNTNHHQKTRVNSGVPEG
jgi:hypothetical protein